MDAGPIRFVGGSKHNEIIAARFLSRIRFPVPSVERAWSFDGGNIPTVQPMYYVEEYELVEMRLPTGCIFREYHAADRLARDGYRECELSGWDGSMHPKEP